MVGLEGFYVIPHVRIPVIYTDDGLWVGVDCSCPRSWYVHDIVQSKLD